MTSLLRGWLCFFLAISSFVFADEIAEKEFIVYSIPKCGSGLINKFFSLASKKKMMGPAAWFPQYSTACATNSFNVEKYLNERIISEVLLKAKRSNAYLFSHTNFSRPFYAYLLEHNRLRIVLQIRDLRDACISLVYWREEMITRAIGNQATFDEKLMFVITGADSIYKDQVYNLKRCAERALEIIDHPNVIVSRFEELVGHKGGGDDASQLLVINELTERLSLQISLEEQEHIASILWGNDEGPQKPTFRKGQINKWKEIFTPRHKKAFKKYFGNTLIRLGYEQDNDW